MPRSKTRCFRFQLTIMRQTEFSTIIESSPKLLRTSFKVWNLPCNRTREKSWRGWGTLSSQSNESSSLQLRNRRRKTGALTMKTGCRTEYKSSLLPSTESRSRELNPNPIPSELLSSSNKECKGFNSLWNTPKAFRSRSSSPSNSFQFLLSTSLCKRVIYTLKRSTIPREKSSPSAETPRSQSRRFESNWMKAKAQLPSTGPRWSPISKNRVLHFSRKTPRNSWSSTNIISPSRNRTWWIPQTRSSLPHSPPNYRRTDWAWEFWVRDPRMISASSASNPIKELYRDKKRTSTLRDRWTLVQRSVPHSDPPLWKRDFLRTVLCLKSCRSCPRPPKESK